MTRPPYLRRVTALLVFVAALAVELRPTTTARLPVATVDLPSGTEVSESDVAWLEVAEELGDSVTLPAVLARDVAAGTPITRSDIDGSPVGVPTGWLTIELEVPPSATRGAGVVAVLPSEVQDGPVAGLVVGTPVPSDFGSPSAMIAFAADDAVAVARGLAAGSVTVLLGS
jgi:hypothetical protein